MPEGDTVWRTCRRLDQVFRGEALHRAELRWGRLIDSDLVGMTTTTARPTAPPQRAGDKEGIPRW